MKKGLLTVLVSSNRAPSECPTTCSAPASVYCASLNMVMECFRLHLVLAVLSGLGSLG